MVDIRPLLKTRKLCPGASILLEHITSSCDATPDPNGFCVLPMSGIEEALGISRVSIVKYIKQLEENKLIVVDRTNKASGYRPAN